MENIFNDADLLKKKTDRYKKCLNKVIEKRMEMIISYHIDKNPEIMMNQMEGELWKSMVTAYNNRRNKISKKDYIFLTVNPMESIGLTEFIKCVKKCMRKKWFHDILYCYEQRGENLEEMGIGKHMHALIRFDKKKSKRDALKEIFNTFKNIVGNPKHVNIQYTNDKEKIKDYIMGIKEIDKMKKVEFDKIWRENNNLSSKYEITG